MEEIMKMPVSDRKFYIQKHNIEQEQLKREMEGPNTGSSVIQGEGINTYAELAQTNKLQ